MSVDAVAVMGCVVVLLLYVDEMDKTKPFAAENGTEWDAPHDSTKINGAVVLHLQP